MSLNPNPKFGPFPVPRQHGAWAMFLVPALMAVTLADQWKWSLLPLIFGFTLIFLSYRPAAQFLRRWKKHRRFDGQAFNWVLLLGGMGLFILAALFIAGRQWWALIVGGLVAVTLIIHLRLTLNKEDMSVPGEIIGVAGLTASAPITYLFLHGTLDARGWVLWLINFLYFSGSIFYIKLKLRIQPFGPEPDLAGKLRAGRALITYCVFIIIFLIIITFLRDYSWFFILAYLPFIAKSLAGVVGWQTKPGLKPNRFGLLELVYSLFFATMSIIGFYHTVR